MDERKGKVILFRIIVDQENGGFSHASNFITKVFNREPVTVEEVRGISSKLVPGNRNFTESKARFLMEGIGFLPIIKPEKLYQGMEGYICEFGLMIEDEYLQDALSIQPFVLMKLYFKKEKIFAVIRGKSSHFFPMNYFLSDVMRRKELEGSIYYFQKDKAKFFALGGRKEGKSISAFYPIQVVDKDMLYFLSNNLEKVWTNGKYSAKETLRKLIGGNKSVWNTAPEKFRGLLRKMSEMKFADTLEADKIISYMIGESTLAFLVFVFSVRDMKEKGESDTFYSFHQFKNYYQLVNDYAAGVLQLIENIVFHADSHSGVFSMRLHDKKREDYLQKKFPEVNEASHLEISVADYQGSNSCDNIASHFVKHVGEERLSSARLSPCDLFDFGQKPDDMDPKVLEAFRIYYRNLENIGKHYGLKLFRNMILKNNGAFHFYSCKSHIPQAGERGGIDTEAEQEVFECFPGTGYSILLPIIGRESGNYAIDADDQNEFREFCGQITAYSGAECEPYFFSGYHVTQSDKEREITQCQNYLSEKFAALQGIGHNIIYIDAESYDESQAELLYKALISQALEMKMPDVVFYHCSERFAGGIQESAVVFLDRIGLEDIFEKKNFCIALYDADDAAETLIYPGSRGNTCRANLMTVHTQGKNWLRPLENDGKSPLPVLKAPRIPYDILYRPIGQNSTIFEWYVKNTLNKNIQGKEYGCKLDNIHMRLGSTIHVSTFFEAELLFGNRYFVSRFALMIAWEIYKKFGDWKPEMKEEFRITLCAYGMYSELLVFRTMEFLRNIYDKTDEDSMDYAILERDLAADRIKHVDRFRYSVAFQSEEERKEHFKKRKIISIVPINSTLKTQDKLLEIFGRENDILFREPVLNFSLILVGPSTSNKYWKLNEKNRTCRPAEKNTMVKPDPCYFVHISIFYYEANKCRLCYPKNPLLEKPLVEVNAYSTVPDQAIGMRNEQLPSWKKGEEEDRYFKIFKENDEELRKLYNSLIYSHIERNGNHFLYYFKTEKLFLEWKDDIQRWLEKKSELIEHEKSGAVNSCHILFCPVHCSNTGFFEYVNHYAFQGAALVVRLDVNKEYRSNLKTKYSNLELLIENMGKNQNEKYTIHAHFVDDCIITGKSFHRMQSLAQSLLNDCIEEYHNVDTIIFERIFVLIDRNSGYSKQQYLCALPGQNTENRREELERRFFSYIHLNISSMRNHGDSCSICQLEWESDGLARTSSSWSMMKYWKDRKKRFEARSVELYEEEQRRQAEKKAAEEIKKTKDRNYRRMYCCHMAGTLLNEKYHGNQEKPVRAGVIKLLLYDLKYREGNEEEQFEYFLSYLKILSRAFLVYQKSIREVIFPVLLVLVQWQLETADAQTYDITDAAQAIWKKEKKDGEFFRLLSGIEEKVLPLLNTVKRRRDILLVCMKQLMEMKSNYFIRKQNMKKLTAYISTWGQDKDIVYEKYLRYVKKLTGVKSDTSKSTWLTEEIKKIMEEKVPEEYLPQHIMRQLLLENNRAYYDGIERLSSEQKLQDMNAMKDRIATLRYRDFWRYLSNNEDIKEKTIWSSIQLIRYLRDEFIQMPQTEEKTRKKYYDIAEIACDILEAEKVYMLMGTLLECEQWKYDFKKEMKEIYQKLFPGQPYHKGTETEKKEYLVVSISGEHETVLEVPIPVVADIEKFDIQKDNDYVDEKKGYFIWKLGMDEEHSIIIYVKFRSDCMTNLLYKCARLMIMNNLLNETAFSSSAIHYLYDIVTAESNANKLSYYKSFSHTPEDIRKQQYSDMVRDGREQYFQSHVITLLSDLRVSENYRSGLKKDYYFNDLKVHYGKLFGKRSIFHKISDFYVVDGMTQEHIRLHINRGLLVGEKGKIIESDVVVPDDQEIAFKGYTNGMDDLLLLIMALIENAASKGKRETEKNGEKIVNVYLSKTEDGDLRIMNEVSKKGDMEKINFFMSRPPQPKDGISIWSVSRYLLSLECSIIRGMISELKAGLEEKDIGNTSQKEDSIVNLYHKAEELLDNLPETQVEYIEFEEKIYFSIKLPIMAEKIRR